MKYKNKNKENLTKNIYEKSYRVLKNFINLKFKIREETFIDFLDNNNLDALNISDFD